MPHQAHLFSQSFGTGETLALVHGFTQTGRSWEPVARELSQKYRVVSVDLPGHGRSSGRFAENLTNAAEMLAATVGHATYVGYSLGGRVCLQLAIDAPELVERLVLIGATPGISDERARLERRRSDEALADALIEEGDLEGFLHEWLAQPLFADLSNDQRDVATRLENTPEGLANALRQLGTGTQTPFHERLQELSMPTLLVAGAEDDKFVGIGAEMLDAIGDNARLCLIHGARHAAPFSKTHEFLSVLHTFLEETSPL